MRAAVYYGPNKVEVADVPEPEPSPGTVKVKVGFNGICGTDLHEYYAGPIFVPTEPHPLTGQQMPLTMGHEFSGVITDVGDGVTGCAEGDRVADRAALPMRALRAVPGGQLQHLCSRSASTG